MRMMIDAANSRDGNQARFSKGFTMTTRAALFLVLLFDMLAYSSTAMADKLKVLGIAGRDKVVVMADARNGRGPGNCANDRIYRSSGSTTLPNFLTSAGCGSEISIFAANNAMLLDTPVNTWTDRSTDVHTVTMQPIITVPVSVWIADAAPGALTKAKKDMARAILLYKRNKVGVQFLPTFTRVANSVVATINNGIRLSASGDPRCDDLAGVQASGSYTPNTLNVYYVAFAFTGRNCAIKQTPPDCASASTFSAGDANITYLGSNANRATLAHEFGHAFGLRPSPCGGHTNGLPGFGPRNIMWGGGDAQRDRFTLGQVLRMNTQVDQWGGTMLIQNGLRAGPGRACPLQTGDAACPALRKDWERP
jgi:hypothetical protein